MNFSDQNEMPNTVNLKETLFADDGSENDLVAGDGVYTSTIRFNHDSVVKFNSLTPIRSTLDAPIVSSKFRYIEQLRSEIAKYNVASGRSKIIEVTCEIEFGTKGCNAQRWGWCDSCCVTIYTDTCSVTFGF